MLESAMQRALCSRKAQLGLLAGLLVSSEALYLALLRLNAVNGIRPVLFFLCPDGGPVCSLRGGVLDCSSHAGT